MVRGTSGCHRFNGTGENRGGKGGVGWLAAEGTLLNKEEGEDKKEHGEPVQSAKCGEKVSQECSRMENVGVF